MKCETASLIISGRSSVQGQYYSWLVAHSEMTAHSSITCIKNCGDHIAQVKCHCRSHICLGVCGKKYMKENRIEKMLFYGVMENH